ncbi:hypothetical protein PR048_003512 [Dryococelus australis]|uniref:Uncharacterized protein n=1 Tax=Dryococelus australis TaxID=614101 RepID=A0ABQ9INA3_9NEOP|nr:hypothetical protein PR048_003512 [Dryococelus australis]
MPGHMRRGMCKLYSINDGYYCFLGLHSRQTYRPSNMSGMWLVGDLFLTVLQQPLLMLCELAYKPRGGRFPRDISRSSMIPCHAMSPSEVIQWKILDSYSGGHRGSILSLVMLILDFQEFRNHYRDVVTREIELGRRLPVLLNTAVVTHEIELGHQLPVLLNTAVVTHEIELDHRLPVLLNTSVVTHEIELGHRLPVLLNTAVVTHEIELDHRLPALLNTAVVTYEIELDHRLPALLNTAVVTHEIELGHRLPALLNTAVVTREIELGHRLPALLNTAVVTREIELGHRLPVLLNTAVVTHEIELGHRLPVLLNETKFLGKDEAGIADHHRLEGDNTWDFHPKLILPRTAYMLISRVSLDLCASDTPSSKHAAPWQLHPNWPGQREERVLSVALENQVSNIAGGRFPLTFTTITVSLVLGPMNSLTSRDSHTICCCNKCPKLSQQVGFENCYQAALNALCPKLSQQVGFENCYQAALNALCPKLSQQVGFENCYQAALNALCPKLSQQVGFENCYQAALNAGHARTRLMTSHDHVGPISALDVKEGQRAGDVVIVKNGGMIHEKPRRSRASRKAGTATRCGRRRWTSVRALEVKGCYLTCAERRPTVDNAGQSASTASDELGPQLPLLPLPAPQQLDTTHQPTPPPPPSLQTSTRSRFLGRLQAPTYLPHQLTRRQPGQVTLLSRRVSPELIESRIELTRDTDNAYHVVRDGKTIIFQEGSMVWAGSVSWLLWSPYLTPLGYFLWWIMKCILHETPLPSEEDLVARTHKATELLGTQPYARQSLHTRCRLCNQVRGRKFDHPCDALPGSMVAARHSVQRTPISISKTFSNFDAPQRPSHVVPDKSPPLKNGKFAVTSREGEGGEEIPSSSCNRPAERGVKSRPRPAIPPPGVERRHREPFATCRELTADRFSIKYRHPEVWGFCSAALASPHHFSNQNKTGCTVRVINEITLTVMWCTEHERGRAMCRNGVERDGLGGSQHQGLESRRGRSEVSIEQRWNERAASSDTIPKCENPGATQPGIEPGSPWGGGGGREP